MLARGIINYHPGMINMVCIKYGGRLACFVLPVKPVMVEGLPTHTACDRQTKAQSRQLQIKRKC